MTEEEIKALQDAKDAADKRASDAESALKVVAGERDAATLSRDSLVEELKTERQKKQEALAKANLSNPEPQDVNAMIAAALEERDANSRKTSFEQAVTEFKLSKQEFQSDPAGIVFAKFQEGLKRFNFSDISDKEQMKNRLEEVYNFLNFKPNTDGAPEYNGSPSNPAPVNSNPDINTNIKTTLEQSGVKEESYRSLKGKYPDALEALGL